MEARKLVDFPGGLELHIGVSLSACTALNCSVTAGCLCTGVINLHCFAFPSTRVCASLEVVCVTRACLTGFWSPHSSLF